MSKRSDVADLIREIETKGWEVKPSRNGHWKAYHPNGKDMIAFASTPSDWRAVKNVRSLVRRLEKVA